ncbi:unnamed protein product, partial [Meganyctiphanes norvegica]
DRPPRTRSPQTFDFVTMNEKHEKLSESIDGNKIGCTNPSKVDNSRQGVDELDAAPQFVSADHSGRDDPFYHMRHAKRGFAIIFKHDEYEPWTGNKPRNCASYDAEECKKTFETLGFEVIEYNNRGREQFEEDLENISKLDLDNCDCLAVIFMSHGSYDEYDNKEYIWLKDGKVLTSTLWNGFTADKCEQLAGKPKLFFIQACRGGKTEKGITLKKGLNVTTDSIDSRKLKDDYTIPFHSDMLIMWASYPEMVSFRRNVDNPGIKGSVFLHFLSQVLRRDYGTEDLSSMLLTVTRNVAIYYKSNCVEKILNNKKQTPYTVSTLMRKVFFGKNQD